MRPRQLWILLTFLILLGLVFASIDGRMGRFAGARRVEMPELVELVEAKKVAAIQVRGATIKATLQDGSRVTTVGPERSDHYIRWFADNGVEPSFQRTDEQWIQLAGMIVPTLILAGFVAFMFRQVQAHNGRTLGFGRSRARLHQAAGRKVTFADAAGCDEAKEELAEIVEYLRHPARFSRLGGRIPKGVLLVGAPGAGKTLLARAVTGEAGVPFFSLSGSEFVEMFVGVGASRVRDLFEQARRQAPCIVFIDEIDAIGRQRGGMAGGGQEEREQTLNQLLVEMDGFEPNDTVILMAATNRPDVLDSALLRPGRFDRRVFVAAPDVRGRLAILRVHAARLALAPEVDLGRVARGTPGFTGADIENLVNEAALLAARGEKTAVGQAEFERARDKVAMGAERRSLLLTDAEKQRTAVHEAGHAVVARLVPGCDPVSKITIVPRGLALGATMSLPEAERHTESRSFRLATLALLMGGRSAEEEVYGEQWSGAENDLRRATRLARAMVCESGMSEALGPVSWGPPPVADGWPPPAPEFSTRTAEQIDEEVRRLLDEAHARARAVLSAHRGLLDAVVVALVEHETLDAEAFEAIVKQHAPAAPAVAGG